MGADVYLESVHNKIRDEWQPKFEAAVKARDAYCIKRGYYPHGEIPAKDGIDPQYDRLQQAVLDAYEGMYGAGYFRDCYNGYGLFSNLRDAEGNTPSWWRDVVPMLNDGYLPVERAAELRRRVVAAKIDLSSARGVAAEQKDDPPKLATYESWRKELVDILDQSLALGEPLMMSL